MKLTLVAGAIALAFPLLAVAQSRGPEADESLLRNMTRVELYGIADVGLESVRNGSGANGTRLSSGISAGSRIGFRGVENLGNGYRVAFVLENRLELDTGRVTNGPALYTCSSTALCPGVTATVPAATLSPAAAAGIAQFASGLNNSLLQAVTTVNGAGALFDRQAFIGLITPVGAIIAGRQYTPGYEIMNRYTSFADATAGQIGQGYTALAIRANNALQYRAELGGFGASLMYGFGGTEGNRNERVNIGKGDDFMGVNLMYNAPAFGAGIGYNVNNTVTYDEPTKKQTGLKTLNVGVRGTVGPVRLFGHYMTRKNDHPVLTQENLQNIPVAAGCLALAANPSAAASCVTTAGNTALAALYLNAFDVDLIRGVPGKVDTKIFHVGAIYTIGASDLYFAYNQAKDKANDVWDNGDAKVNHYAAAYFYNMSKRTQLFGVWATARNKGSARLGLGAAGYSGGFTTAAGQASTVVQAGIRHAF